MAFVNRISSQILRNTLRNQPQTYINSSRLLCSQGSTPTETKTNPQTEVKDETPKTFASLLRNSKFVDVSCAFKNIPKIIKIMSF